MAFVKIILLPLSVIYGVVTGVRNFLFHIGILKSQTFRIYLLTNTRAGYIFLLI